MSEDLDILERMTQLRKRVLAGEELTAEEAGEVIAQLRQSRTAAAASSKKAKAKPATATLDDLNSLFDDGSKA